MCQRIKHKYRENIPRRFKCIKSVISMCLGNKSGVNRIKIHSLMREGSIRLGTLCNQGIQSIVEIKEYMATLQGCSFSKDPFQTHTFPQIYHNIEFFQPQLALFTLTLKL